MRRDQGGLVGAVFESANSDCMLGICKIVRWQFIAYTKGFRK